MDPPHASVGVAVQQPEPRLGDEVDHLIVRQEVVPVKIGSPRAVPDDHLPQRKVLQDVVVADDQAILDPMHVVVEDGAVRLQHPEHLGKAQALPLDVRVVGHVVAVPVVAVPATGAVARAVQQVIGRGRNDQVDRCVGQLRQQLQDVALVNGVEPGCYVRVGQNLKSPLNRY